MLGTSPIHEKMFGAHREEWLCKRALSLIFVAIHNKLYTNQ